MPTIIRVVGVAASFYCTAVAHAQTLRKSDTVWVADRYVSTSVVGAEILAKFVTRSDRNRALQLDSPVATSRGRTWTLDDILVQADINGSGYIAIWIVAGPREVIDAYLGKIREAARSASPIYDLSIQKRIVRCACDDQDSSTLPPPEEPLLLQTQQDSCALSRCNFVRKPHSVQRSAISGFYSRTRC